MVVFKMYSLLDAQTNSEVVSHRFIVQEIIFDDISLIAQTQDEALKPILSINLHDMPQNRASANLDHRFGFVLRLFAKAGSFTPAQNHYRYIGRIHHARTFTACFTN